MEEINVLKGIFNSWTFIGVMSSTIIFQVIIVEFLGTFANTVPLKWQLWVLSVVIGSISLIIAIGLKFIPVVEVVKPSRQNSDGYQPLANGPEELA